jgi:hypothetical protein
LIRGCEATETGGVCEASDGCLEASCWSDPCGGCEALAGPADGGAYWPSELSGDIGWYWSSDEVASGPSGDAWLVGYDDGRVTYDPVDRDYGARCVRGS